MKVLVTGANGQLGKALQEEAHQFPESTFVFATKEQLDITQPEQVAHWLQTHAITHIINTAAYTNVALAAQETEKAFHINHVAVAQLAHLAVAHQCALLHISTDYVFDGTKKTPYQPTDATHPVNVYGASKAAGEKAMLEINPPNSAIVRTSWLFSAYPPNFVTTIYKACQTKPTLEVVDDQLGSPSYANDVAKALCALLPQLSQPHTQVYHITNSGSCSWYTLAKAIAAKTAPSCEVIPIHSNGISNGVKRPTYSVLGTTNLPPLRSWEEALDACLTAINSPKSY